MAKTTKAASAAAQAAIEAARPKPAPKPVAPEMAGEAGTIVLVRGPEDGRRRGGLTFGPIDIEVDLGQIARANFEAILADPHLKVRPKPAEDEAE